MRAGRACGVPQFQLPQRTPGQTRQARDGRRGPPGGAWAGPGAHCGVGPAWVLEIICLLSPSPMSCLARGMTSKTKHRLRRPQERRHLPPRGRSPRRMTKSPASQWKPRLRLRRRGRPRPHQCDGPGLVAISFWASSQRPEMTSGSSLGLDINPRAGACRRREEGRRSVLIRRSGSLPRPRRTGAAGHTAALTTGWPFQRPAAAGL